MALQFGDRVRETTTTSGTGALALAGTIPDYQAFSAILSNGDTCYYAVTDGGQWETGLGTYTSSTNTLARTTIFQSSNGNAAVSWGAGVKSIWLDAPAFFFQHATGFKTVTAASYTVLAADNIINVNRNGNVAITGGVGRQVGPAGEFTIKDAGGFAATHNITYTPASGTIDGAASKKIQQAYDSLTIYTDGTNEFIK